MACITSCYLRCGEKLRILRVKTRLKFLPLLTAENSWKQLRHSYKTMTRTIRYFIWKKRMAKPGSRVLEAGSLQEQSRTVSRLGEWTIFSPGQLRLCLSHLSSPAKGMVMRVFLM